MGSATETVGAGAAAPLLRPKQRAGGLAAKIAAIDRQLSAAWQMAAKKGATVMYLDATVRGALPAARQSWFATIARALAKWVVGPRAARRRRWYDCDGVHRGF